MIYLLVVSQNVLVPASSTGQVHFETSYQKIKAFWGWLISALKSQAVSANLKVIVFIVMKTIESFRLCRSILSEAGAIPCIRQMYRVVCSVPGYG